MLNRQELRNVGLDNEDIKEVIEALRSDSKDFEVANRRFIHERDIDTIMCEELESDLYVLGCCTDWFIADITGLDIDVITNAQKAESFELLGALMAQDIGNVQSQMVSHDGYGHHFNHWDGTEDEITMSCSCCDRSYWRTFYVFRTN